CEEYAVARTQAAHLAFIVRAEVRVFSRLVDKSIPDVDIDHAGALGAGTIEGIEVDGRSGLLWAADRRQTDPEYRHAFALERGDRVVDALRIDLGPLVGAEFDRTGCPLARLRFGCRDRILLSVLDLILRLGFFFRRLFAYFIFFFLLVRFLRQVALADILTVADTEHHHNEIRLLLSEDVARNMPPIEIALRLVSQQSRVQFVFADNGNFRRSTEG